MDILLSQGYTVSQLVNSFQASDDSDGKYPDLIAMHQRSIRDMLNDSFPTSYIYNV